MKKLLIVSLVMLFGMGMMAGNARADNYDPTGAPGAPPLVQLGGTLWNHGGIGDALYGQMYRAVIGDTVSDPFRFVTYISIENVSNNFVAAHVRLRSGRYSIEVRDFPILLSPRDVFWFQFEVIPDGSGGIEAVRIFSNDAGTLALSGLPSPSWDEHLDGRILRQFTKLEYTNEEIFEEMTQGYIEVFGLFELPRIPAGSNVINIMSTLWNTSVDVGPAGAPDWRAMVGGVAPLDVQKSLAGHVFMGDFENGLYFGYAMDAIKDFRTDFAIGVGPRHRDIAAVKADGLGAIVPLRTGFAVNGAGVPGGLNSATAAPAQGWYNSACILYSYGQDHAYTNPDWATNFGPTWNDGDDLTGGGQWGFDSWSLDEIDDAFVKQRVQAPYFNGGFSFVGGNSGTYTLAAVTFGTKYLHYFYDIMSGLVKEDNIVPLGDMIDGTFGSGRFGWPVGFQPDLALGVRDRLPVELWTGQVSLRTAAWDLAEKTPLDWSPFTTVRFPYELNFIAIGDLSIEMLDPFCFLMVDQTDAPYGLLTYDGGYFAGQFMMEGFALYGGILAGDPRTILWNAFATGGYNRAVLPLLSVLQAAPYNDYYILPASVLMMDWEFTNFSHARSYKANWDNLVLPADYPIRAIGAR